MIVMLIGGPGAGLFQNLPEKKEYRIATAKMLSDGKAAFYTVIGQSYDPKLRFMLASATFTNVRDSASSLVDLVVDSSFGNNGDAPGVDSTEQKEA